MSKKLVKREKHLHIRLNEHEFEIIEIYAEELNMKKSELGREAIKRYIRYLENPQPEKNYELKEIIIKFQKILRGFENLLDDRRRKIPKEIKRQVWKRDKGMCIECGSKLNLEYDHIIPFSKGGSNSVLNIQLLCQKCNNKKRDKIE